MTDSAVECSQLSYDSGVPESTREIVRNEAVWKEWLRTTSRNVPCSGVRLARGCEHGLGWGLPEVAPRPKPA